MSANKSLFEVFICKFPVNRMHSLASNNDFKCCVCMLHCYILVHMHPLSYFLIVFVFHATPCIHVLRKGLSTHKSPYFFADNCIKNNKK